MIKKLFSGQINSITIAALLVALSSLVSRFLGVFRDRILAGEFGAGDVLDVYYAAFRIPDLIFNLLVLGALSAGFIPILSCLIGKSSSLECFSLKRKSNKDAWEFVSNVLNILGLVLIILSGVGIIFAPEIMKFITPGFFGEKQKAVVELTRIMFLSPIFLGISSVLGGILQSFKRFFLYSLSPIFYNIGIIIGALYFAPAFGINGLAWGVVLGAFMHMSLQIPMVFKLGFRYRLIIDFKNKNLIKTAVMTIPRVLSLAVSQVNLLVITIIASTLASGSLAIFNFANNLQFLPISVFGISFAVAAFPTLSIVAFDRKKLIFNFSNTFRQILFFVVPATVLLLTLRAQIIRVVLGTGSFDWNDTILTIDTLGFFAISIFAQASIPLFVRMFYARHNSKTPFIVGMISALINVGLSFYFSGKLGVPGLALAFSISSIINFMLLWMVLRFDIGDMDEFHIFISSLKFSLAAVAAGIAVQGGKYLMADFFGTDTFLRVLSQGLFAGIAGIGVYVAFCSLLKSEELFSFWNSIKRRLPWKKIETGDQSEARGI
ncbi:MAG: murein biosynthesis integral membrane protein MurJ [Patescibacteria group bacterium]|nr:murein biosynthesis integral membrane protein MurJ [Patescibacteria group bacterium]